MQTQEFITTAFQQPGAGLTYHVSRTLAEMFPDRTILETDSWRFRLHNYEFVGLCKITPKTMPFPQFTSHWGVENHANHLAAVQVWFEVKWQNYTLEVLELTISCNKHYWIIADIREIAESFFGAVCEWESEIRQEVLVFSGYYWDKDEKLYQAIQSSTFDNLILQGTLANDILADVQRFFKAESLYDRFNIPWRRGILLVGPPGNGKTHTVKALVNALGLPCLYVRSFKNSSTTDEYNIQRVFERAREVSPCILVFEDLDSQVTPQNRSFFLNELDGFDDNEGILVVATTNYPEKLDPAITNRPSRFDRKYPFSMPEVAQRKAYIAQWNETLQAEVRLSEELVSRVAAQTDGFSFAYLKELFVSSLVSWFERYEQDNSHLLGEAMLDQVTVLLEQMTSPTTDPPASSNENENDNE